MYQKKYYTFLLICLFISFSISVSAEKVELSDPDWIQEANKVIVYKAENYKHHLINEKSYHQNKKFDLYLPEADTTPPLVILIHGGPIPDTLKTKPKDWGFFTSYGQAIAKSGFAAITFNHSLYELSAFSESHQDINDLISYIRTHSAALGVDKDNIILWFFSGAGPLMAPFINQQPDFIKGIIGFYPLLNLSHYKKYLPEEKAQNILDKYTPEQMLSSEFSTPIFIARAELDSKELNGTIDSFIKKAKAVKANVILHNNIKGRHGFDNDLGENEADTIKIIQSAIEFIDKQT